MDSNPKGTVQNLLYPDRVWSLHTSTNQVHSAEPVIHYLTPSETIHLMLSFDDVCTSIPNLASLPLHFQIYKYQTQGCDAHGLALQIFFTGNKKIVKEDVLAAPMPEMKEPEVIRTLELPNGVRFQEVIEGEGPEAQEGDTVEVNYVCRRSNGYFVHSTVDQFTGESSPVILPLDENQVW
ncbi:hypothetical protein NC652_004667 [Populus alba x Populus x berolinensis]|nr:hypothetical protein NC652_004667 [Populus alba x Populus x berolinensis]